MLVAGRTRGPGPEGNGPSKEWQVAGCSIEPLLDLEAEP
jgi:hypothetical protein